MSKSRVRILLGSRSDRATANIILDILKEIGIPYKVSVASCHWHTGAGLEEFVREIDEDLLAIIGGLQFNLPSIVKTILKTDGQTYKLVLAIPTDKTAKRANEDFPAGTVVFTAGFNSINPKAGYVNSALGIAELVVLSYSDFIPKLQAYYEKLKKEKILEEKVSLENGLIPEPPNPNPKI
ncbi:AIR carboxylase family protein [Candidatus Falkowbacteria bacterium]|nr:AIR carboxylase family protein [Candidatus Falkowbacteria bacterium]